MKPMGRAGLLALVAVVLLAHAWVLQAVSGGLSAGAAPAAPPVTTTSQVRLVAPPAPTAPPSAPSRVAELSPRPASVAPARHPIPSRPPASEATPVAGAAPASDRPAPAEHPAVVAEVETAPPAPAPAADAPRPVSLPPDADLKYQVEGQARSLRYRASGELRWRQADGAYELSMRLSAFLVGSRSQTSTGRVDATGLLPDRFSDRTRSEKAAHFDRAAQRIRFSNNAPDAPLLPGAQDRLSVFLQLAGLLQAGGIRTGDTLELPVAGVGGSAAWRFAVGELESLELPAGTLLARHLVREPADTYDSRVEVWLAPELGHLPVRLRITQSQGDVADQQLSERP